MRFHEILDEVLGNRTKVKLLRAFTAYPDKEFSESELQRIAGIPQASVHRNVGALFENGLLHRRRIGKANLYSVNREHLLFPVVHRLFEEERDLLKKLKKTIAGKINRVPEVKLAVLFGSVVKGRERADSDVDLFIVTGGKKETTEEKLKDLNSVLKAKFGNPLSLLIKTENELEDLETRAIFREIKEGDVILKRRGFEW
ncbi:MAG: helix-turn-helix domain-containing protein [Euryarchaeota archaeon]|nr:helix-turn-helix domain-containing protein [Euryarchaeota archaeon]